MSLLLLLVCLNIFWRSTLSLTCKIRKGKVPLVKKRELELLSLPQLYTLAPSQRTREAGCIRLRQLMKTVSVVTASQAHNRAICRAVML